MSSQHATEVHARVAAERCAALRPLAACVSRTMKMADHTAEPSDHRSPMLGSPPSLTSRSVPMTAIETQTHVRSPMRRSPNIMAITGTIVAFRYSKKAERDACHVCANRPMSA